MCEIACQVHLEGRAADAPIPRNSPPIAIEYTPYHPSMSLLVLVESSGPRPPSRLAAGRRLKSRLIAQMQRNHGGSYAHHTALSLFITVAILRKHPWLKIFLVPCLSTVTPCQPARVLAGGGSATPKKTMTAGRFEKGMAQTRSICRSRVRGRRLEACEKIDAVPHARVAGDRLLYLRNRKPQTTGPFSS